MQANIDFLVLYAEVSIAFVAFTTIVATLRQTITGALRPLQYLLFRFFVDSGLLQLFTALIPIALFHIVPDELTVWRLSNYVILCTALPYLPYYIWRRRRIDAPVPPLSLGVMVGYAIIILTAMVTASEIFWQPSLTTLTLYLLWGLASNSAIFALFLGSFVSVVEDSPAVQRATPPPVFGGTDI